MSTRRNTRRGSGFGRRKLVWARQANTGAAIAAGAGNAFRADLLSPFRTQLGARTPGITIMRIRLQWMLLDTDAQSRLVIMGIRGYTQSPDDPAAETLEVDGPAADPHADWMAYDSMLLQAEDNAGFSELQRDVDVKSMRKLDEVSDSLAIAFQAADELAATVRYVASVLVALP